MPARPLSPSVRLAALLSRFPSETVALATRCLTTLRRACPGSLQLVYDYRSSLVVAFGMSEVGHEAVLSTAISARWVRLYVRKDVPDPAGRLEGSGAQVRSVTLQEPADLQHPDIRALIRGAIQHAGVVFPRGRPIRIVFKSASKPKRARRGASAP